MIGRMLSVELLKIRRKLLWMLAALGPVGVIGLQAVNYGLRYDYLMKLYGDSPWEGLLRQVGSLMLPALFIGLALVASMSAGIEHQAGAWKQLLALPVTRLQVFGGKVMLSLLLLLASCTLLLLLTLGMGLLLGFDPQVPWAEIVRQSYLPYLAALPFIALQSWLSIVMANQALPLTVGTLGMVLSMFSLLMPAWMPWGWPDRAVRSADALQAAGSGLALGVLVLLIGYAHFARKDVS
ncbi:ABC transporter permease [Paenibacillus humicus]|uniref:ABC transporter permease n=1 Tax=Paenibacillus humicus TaxID=412861 RepID=UPI003F5CE7DF